MKKNIGSSIGDFMKEEGIFEEAQAQAIKEVYAAEILKKALALDVEDRALLAERLLASLDDLDEAEAERTWALEAQRRLDQYRAGDARVVGAHSVAEKAGQSTNVTKRSKHVATVGSVPTAKRGKRKTFGYMKGTGRIVGDIESPASNPEDWEALRN